MKRRCCLLLLAVGCATQTLADAPPKAGDMAPPLKLTSVDGKSTADLEQLRQSGPVVIVMLRGYPGYQCPICTRQVGGLLQAAEKLKAANAKVVLVYPGPGEKLADHAREFTSQMTFPEGIQLVTDPDYSFTNEWNLRWDAPRETAFPSTFIVGPDGKIRFARVSRSHGGRTSADEILGKLGEL